MNDENIGALSTILQIEKTIQNTLKDVVSSTMYNTSNDPLKRKLYSLLNTNEQYLKQLEDVYNRGSE